MSSVPPVEPVVVPAVVPLIDPNIVQLRNHANTLEAELKAERVKSATLDEQIKSTERAKLDDVKRLELEKEDLAKKVAEYEPLKAKVESNDAFFKGMFERELATLDPAIQENAKKLTEGAGSESQRLEMLTLFKASIPAPVIPSVRGGSPGAPGLPGSVPQLQAAPVEVDPANWDKPVGGFGAMIMEAAQAPGVQRQIIVTPEQQKAQ